MTKYSDPDGFAEWEATIPESFKRDPIWRTPAYRYAVWLSDLAKLDARILRADPDTRTDVDQFLRAVGSISSQRPTSLRLELGRESDEYVPPGVERKTLVPAQERLVRFVRQVADAYVEPHRNRPDVTRDAGVEA